MVNGLTSLGIVPLGSASVLDLTAALYPLTIGLLVVTGIGVLSLLFLAFQQTRSHPIAPTTRSASPVDLSEAA